MHIKKFYGLCVFMLLALPVQAAYDPDAMVGAVILEGVSAFPGQNLFPAYADSLGRPLTRENGARLKEQIAAFYTSRNYLPPFIEISSHPDAQEVWVAQVTEPRIGEVHLRAAGTNAATLQQQAQKITEQQVVSLDQIDTLVNELEQSLGLKISSSVHRLDDTGAEYFLLLEVVPQVRTQLTYSAEGSERLGRHMVGAEIDVDNPFQGVARAYVSALHTLESAGYRNFGTGLVIPASPRDYIFLDASLSRAVPQYERDGPADIYRRQWARVSWRHQLSETSKRKISLTGRLILRDYTREEGDETEVDERLRMVSVGAQKTLRDGKRTHLFWGAAKLGFDALGAQRKGTQNWGNIDVGFRAFEAGYTLWHALPESFTARLDLASQYSGDNVPYSQRFAFGGTRFARAYEPGEFSGDSGLGAKLEVRRGFDTEQLLRSRLVPYVYYGLAKTYQNEYDVDDSGASAGLGLRMLADDFSAYLEYGKPLTVSSDYRGDSPRLAGRLNVMF